ncbi:GNAT family N-acetyltransferase [Undibacterium cyanobacteriorum]|uniref:GNAT family N-acetyltransferase n=1 Tax=Undibacterium cyanobacteriorum TaxID=3073561 RepID=A0ABY9RDB0_9BURK|nr:GNAT family N-acetyltransferase [Undibacterium sp. 20NA77.5]WMW78961.1 GNAT family N-acetyltransferase [Undibacterium sp. 20NA77.5]
MTLSVRNAHPNDAATIHRFVVELAIYEKAEHEVKASIADIEQSIFAVDSPVKAFICEMNGEAIGFAVYFYNYSTWQGRKGMYLEDLYISPKSRGLGAGKFLLQHLAKIAVAEGCGRFEWSVLDWNQPAIDFYHAVGAKPQSEWVKYRLAGDDLLKFADA